MKVILSIKPEFVEKIIKGEKEFEFRRRIFNKKVESVIVYASSPIKKIVGEFTISEILNYDLNTLWNKTKHKSGISQNFFYEYFKGLKKGYAIRIKKFYTYKSELKLDELGMLTAPQSFIYFNESMYEILAAKMQTSAKPVSYMKADSIELEHEIDKLMYKFYDLTEEELRIIEKK